MTRTDRILEEMQAVALVPWLVLAWWVSLPWREWDGEE